MKSYLEWLIEDEEKLDEASLGRFIQHMDKKEPFAIISAYRYGESSAKNNSATNSMRSEILSAGFGFHKCVGGYVEVDPETGKPHDVTDEKSSIVYGTQDTEKKLRTFAFELGVKYRQNSILWCGSDGKAMWRYTSSFWDGENKHNRGDATPLGAFTPGRIGDYFSKIGKKHFTFKSIED